MQGMTLSGRFWRLASSSGASNLADGVVQVALPLLALQLTRSPLLIAGLAVAARLPWLVFALLAGVVVDRVDRRRLMLVVEILRAAAIAAVAGLVVLDVVELWHLYVLALLLGVAETVFDTAAQSVLPAVVETDQLSHANSRLYGVEVTTNTFLGPPLGGLLAGTAIALAFVGSAAGYVLAAALLVTVSGRFRPARHAQPGTVREDLAEGLSYLWGHALLRRLALLVGGVSLTSSAMFAVLPVYAVDPGPMRLSETEFGIFLTATGVGAVLASLTAERVTARLGPAPSLRLAIVAVAVMLASPIAVQPLGVAAAMAVGAYFIVVWNVITVSLRQRIVPDHLLGRVNSAYRLLAWGGGPLGAAAGGLIAQALDIRLAFAIAALGALTLLLAMHPLTDAALKPMD